MLLCNGCSSTVGVWRRSRACTDRYRYGHPHHAADSNNSAYCYRHQRAHRNFDAGADCNFD